MTAIAEHLLAAMLLLGFGTRIAAFGLLLMTAVIEIFVYPEAYPVHATWAALLLYLVARGPGPISIDAWIARRLIDPASDVPQACRPARSPRSPANTTAR